MPDADELLRRQKVLGEFGEFVLDSNDLQEILNEGCRLIAEALGADLAKIVEIERDTDSGLIRAGVGWKPGVVGNARVSLSERSSEAYAIEKAEPIITQDILHEDRFEFPDFLKDHGVVALVNVPIFLPGRKPWGLLQVDAREPREFGEEDIEYLKTYSIVLGPVIDRLQRVAELRETDERLRLILENAHSYAIMLTDANGIITDWLAGSERIFGWTSDEAVGKPVALVFTPEDRDAGVPEQEARCAADEGIGPDVRWHVRKDGSRVFIDGQTVPLPDKNGAVRGFLKIGQDVTDRRRNEERQAVLLAELQHRVRNVLAMIRSLVHRTISGGSSVREIGEQLDGRINALARTQTLLTRALGVGVDLESIVRDELEAQAAEQGRFTVAGPRVELAPKAAEVVTLAIHELATNASKHGALRHSGGTIAIDWRIDEQAQQPWLRFSWREQGVQHGASADPRSGFGTELITRRVPYELRGEGRIRYTDIGAEASIDFPLVEGASVLQTSEPRIERNRGSAA